MTDDEVSEIKGGWTEGDKQMASTSSYAQTLKLEEKAQVIKFLDDTPYANFRRHWIERTTKDSGKTIRAYGCPKTVGKECPLCDAGDRPQAVAAFNIVIVGDDDNLVLKSWDVGPRLFQVLKGYANDPKIGPLTKGFFIASQHRQARHHPAQRLSGQPHGPGRGLRHHASVQGRTGQGSQGQVHARHRGDRQGQGLARACRRDGRRVRMSHGSSPCPSRLRRGKAGGQGLARRA